MKKFTFLVLFCAVATVASAQFLLGGQFNFSSFKNKSEGGGFGNGENTITFVTLVPRLAYASGNMWYGLDAGVTLINEKDNFGNDPDEIKTTIATVAPFFRYIKRPVDNFGIWIEGQAGVSFGDEKNEDGNIQEKYSGFNVGLKPGVIFFIGDHLSFEASFGRLGYTSFTVKNPSDDRDKQTISQVGLSLNSNAFLLDDTSLNFSSGFLFGVNWLF